MTTPETEPLAFEELPPAEMRARAEAFRALMARRRSVRAFSDRAVPRDLVEAAVRTAASAPSGANQQPWTFVCVSDRALKRRIRLAAEEEERAFYAGRAGAEWLHALAPVKHYYVSESVGIACGLLVAALHGAGLATLTHTPAPMDFLSDLCGRPAHEKPFLLLVTGYPAPGCRVPRISRRPFDEVAVFVE